MHDRSPRETLVERLCRRGLIRSAQVRHAFLTVPRERFVPEHVAQRGLEAVYRDEVIVTLKDEHGAALSSSSQPGIMAQMLEHLHLMPGLQVLEIGAGTGYNAALLGELVGPHGRVVTLDVDATVAARARPWRPARGPDDAWARRKGVVSRQHSRTAGHQASRP